MKLKFKIGDRVRFSNYSNKLLWARTGTVGGYSTMQPPMPIVILDEPLTHPEYFGWTAVCVGESFLDKEIDQENTCQT